MHCAWVSFGRYQGVAENGKCNRRRCTSWCPNFREKGVFEPSSDPVRLLHLAQSIRPWPLALYDMARLRWRPMAAQWRLRGREASWWAWPLRRGPLRTLECSGGARRWLGAQWWPMGKEEGFRFQPGRCQIRAKIGSVRFESSYSWSFSTQNDLARFLTEQPITRFRPIFAT